MDPAFINWLVSGAVGPALVALPVDWTASALVNVTRRWIARVGHTDSLSRLVSAAGVTDRLTRREFAAIRRSLESPQTWRLVSSGTIEDVVDKISACLSEGGNRSAADSHIAAGAIVQALLESAAAELEPETFQRVLLARLARLEANQSAALDKAMLCINADLVARFAQQSQDVEQRFQRTMIQLGQVLDRLPAAPAGREEIALYLAALIRWMNSDPWPRDPRLRGPVLTPAAIERERKINVVHALVNPTLDSDDLVRLCTRLIILGDAGSGKSWLARRAARRCADVALRALTDGISLDEIELPLFTTCSLLADAKGNIRHAVVSSALDQLGDLGGSRVATALSAFFTERNAPTLLVIDSLDEARNPDSRLRQTDTLPWRIILTSRPSSWREQIYVSDIDPRHKLTYLRPLRYPDDVRPFIAQWFHHESGLAESLFAQLAARRDLQQSTTVPLLLAFYCIIGGDRPLPTRRRELYSLVLRRILTGLWRQTGRDSPDPDACSAILRDWAWAGATRDESSGIGTWTEEILTPYTPMSQAERDAVEHVATSLGPENLDTSITVRRFIHRTIREHMTAEHIANRMTADQAATELMNHIWYDPDWDYAAPAALAMHPQRDLILLELIRRAVRSQQIPESLAAIDGCREFRRFLAKVAQESDEADWTSECVVIISRARLDLAVDGLPDVLWRAPGWDRSDHLIRQTLATRLSRQSDPSKARNLMQTIAGLGPGGQQMAGEALIAALSRQVDPTKAGDVAETLAGLGRSERERAGQALLEMLSRQADPWKARNVVRELNGLRPNRDERKRARHALLRLLARSSHADAAGMLVETLIALGLDSDEGYQVGQLLLRLLDNQTATRQAIVLAQTLARLGPDERVQAGQVLLDLMFRQADPLKALEVVDALNALKPDPAERDLARQILLDMLVRENDVRFVRMLAEKLLKFSLRPDERAQAGQALLDLMFRQADPLKALEVVDALNALKPDPAERDLARQILLSLLSQETDVRFARMLARTLTELQMRPDERVQTGQVLLDLLSRQADPWKARDMVVEVLGQLEPGPSPDELRQIRQILLAQLVQSTGAQGAKMLSEALVELDINTEERKEVRRILLSLLARSSGPGASELLGAGIGVLAETLAELRPTVDEREQARKLLLTSLTSETRAAISYKVTNALVMLEQVKAPPEQEVELKRADSRETDPKGPTQFEQAQQSILARLANETDMTEVQNLVEALAALGTSGRMNAGQVLLDLLSRQADPMKAQHLVNTLNSINPILVELKKARQFLLGLLARETYVRFATMLTTTLIDLELDPDDRYQACQKLLDLLGRQTDSREAVSLACALAGLGTSERNQARRVLLDLLSRQADPWKAQGVVRALNDLEPSPEERKEARKALVMLLARETDVRMAGMLTESLVSLEPGPDERYEAGQALLVLLSRESRSPKARALAKALARLKPDISVLEGWQFWAVVPDSELLAAARRNSTLTCWIDFLPELADLPATQ